MLAQTEPASIYLQIPIPCGPVTLQGELTVPTGANGIVIFVHGKGSSRFSPRNQFVARTIRDSGNGTLLFDLFNQEEEAKDMDTANLRFDIPLLAKRLTTVTRWLRAQPLMGDLGIGYFGSSTGGAAALLAAVEGEDKIDAVVSRGGRPDLAGSALHRVHVPTLLIVGGCDEAVIRLNEKAFSVLRCKKELKVIPGATHLFPEPGALAAVARLAADWFSDHLRRHPDSID